MPKDPFKDMKVETIQVAAQKGGFVPSWPTQPEPPVQCYITDAVLQFFLEERRKYRLFHRAGLKIVNKKNNQ